jgi:hypothetical protein
MHTKCMFHSQNFDLNEFAFSQPIELLFRSDIIIYRMIYHYYFYYYYYWLCGIVDATTAAPLKIVFFK